MNILPKKRWHVRTKENIARVRKDEAAAAEEEKERIRRVKLAEQEARTAYLRARNHSAIETKHEVGVEECPDSNKNHNLSQADEAQIYTARGNINFFKDLEDGKQTSATNKEHEAEKKAEQEKYEKSIGYLTYLGQDSLESKGEKAWYELHSVAKVTDCDLEPKNEEIGLKSKSRLDPINDIIKYTGLKLVKKVVGSSGVTLIKEQSCSTAVNLVSDSTIKEGKTKFGFHDTKVIPNEKKKAKHTKKDHKHKKKKHKHDEREKKKRRGNLKYNKRKERISYSNKEKLKDKKYSDENSVHKKHKKRKIRESCSSKQKYDSDSSEFENCTKRRRKNNNRSNSDHSSSYSGSLSDSDWEEEQREKQKKIEILRAERLKREAEERRRAERLLAGQKPDVVEKAISSTAGYQQKYNSQYNPHIARQNQEPKPLDSNTKYWL